jgi:hypothetical protein
MAAVRARAVLLAIVFAAVGVTREASAQQASDAPPAGPLEGTIGSAGADKPAAWETAAPERRGSFAMGIGLGGGVGAAYGYPNDSAKIGHPAYHATSGAGAALGSTIWIGGALADWLSFGVGFGYSNILSAETSSPAPYGLFHTDLYPLYGLGKAFRDLGAMADFGLGFPTTTDKKTNLAIIQGEASSYVFVGIGWEGLTAWKLRMGPFAGIHYMFSDSVSRPVGLIGFRMTLYAKP